MTNRTAWSQEQTFSISISGKPLSEALDILINQTRINLFYESDMVAEKQAYCSIENGALDEVLRCILQRTDLDYFQLSSGMYVLIDRPRAEARFGALAGLVVDAQTGEPLPNASILLAHAETGTATNDDGRFSFSRLLPGAHPIVITHVAYQDLLDSLNVGPGENISAQFQMNPRTYVSSPIVIDGLQERMPSEQLATHRIAAEELTLNPSATPSTHQALKNMVGVSGGDAFADIHLQGGDTGEHLYTLDGAPVFVPIRNGGLFGSFSPFALEQITVHKAGYDASEGSFLSGVVALQHELTSNKDALMDVQIDPLSVNTRLQGSTKENDRFQLSWMATGRLGLWGVLQPDPIQDQLLEWSQPNTFLYHSLVPDASADSVNTASRSTPDIRFSDLHFATRIRLGPLRSLYISIYQGRNQFGEELSLVEEDSNHEGSTRYKWSNKMAQVRYEWVLRHSTFIQVGAWSSAYRLTHPVDRFPFSPGDTAEPDHANEPEEANEVEDFNEITETGIRIGFDSSIGSKHTVSGVIEPIFTHSDFSLSVDPFGLTSPITDQSILPVKARIQSFLQDNIALGTNTQLKIGSRFTYVPAQQRLYAEPRFSIRHDVPNGPGGLWAFHAAAGVYRQFIFQYDVSDYNQSTLLPGFRFWIPVGKNERASTAYHVAAGILYVPAEPFSIRMEGYYKHQPLLSVLDYVDKDGLQDAEGYAYGGGIAMTYDIPLMHFRVQYAYGLARRRMENRFNGDFVPVPWNAPHQFNAVLDLRLGKGFMVTIRWQGIHNRAWAYKKAYYDYLEPLDGQSPSGPGIPSFNSPSQHQLSPYSRTDAGISYQHDVGKVRIQARMDLINVWNQKNAFDWIIEQQGSTYNNRERLTLPFYSSASLRIQY